MVIEVKGLPKQASSENKHQNLSLLQPELCFDKLRSDKNGVSNERGKNEKIIRILYWYSRFN